MTTTLGEAVIGVGADTSGFEEDVKGKSEAAAKSASKSMQTIGKSVTGVGTKLSLGVTTPLVGIAVAAVHTAAEFQTTMNIMQATSGASGKQVESLSALAKKLGADTIYSANDAADAMLELAKGGFKPAQIAGGGVQATMALAATEGMKLGDAATITANAMNTFGLKAKNASKIADALAGGSNASTASVTSLAQALSQVGPGAKNAGLSLNDTVGVLAAFDNAGVKGSDAGTSLKTMLTRLVPQTKQAMGAMENLGLMTYSSGGAMQKLAKDGIHPASGSLKDVTSAVSGYLVKQGIAKAGTQALTKATQQYLESSGSLHSAFVDQNGQFKSITQIAGILQDKLKGLSQAQRTTAMYQIFGSDSTRAATILMNDGAKGVAKFIKATQAQGAAQKLANARMKGTAGAIEMMKGSIDTAALAIGQILLPFVTQAANFVAKLANAFVAMSPHVQKAALIFGVVAAAIGPLLVIVGTLISSVGTIIGVFEGVTLAMAAPYIAIGLLVAALVLLYMKSKTVRDIVNKAFGDIEKAVLPAVSQIVAMVKGQLIPAFVAIEPLLTKVAAIFLTVFAKIVIDSIKAVVKIITGIVQVITGIVEIVSGIFTGNWSRVWQGMKDVVGGVLKIIVGLIELQFAKFRVLFSLGLDALKFLAEAAWDGIKKLFSLALDGIKSLLKKALDIWLAPWKALFNGLQDAGRAGWDKIKTLFSNAMGAVKTGLGNAFDAVKRVFTEAFETIKGIVTTRVQNIITNFSSIDNLKAAADRAWNDVKGAFTDGIGKAVTSVKSLAGKVKTAAGNLPSALEHAGEQLIEGLIHGIESKVGALTSKISSIANKVKGFFPGSPVKEGPLTSWNDGSPGKHLMDMLGKGIDAGASVASAAMGRAAGAVASTASTATDKAADAVKKKAPKILYKSGTWVISGFTKGLKDGADGVRSYLNSMMDDLRKAGEKGAEGVVTKFRARILPLAHALDDVKTKLAAAKSDLASKLDEMNSYAQNVGSNLVSSVFTANDDQTPVTFDQMIAKLKKQQDDTLAFAKVLKQLKDEGLNDTSYDQIAQGGIDSLQAAQALVAAGQSGVDQVNQIQGTIDKASTTAGTIAAQYLYQGGVDAANALVDHLQSRQKDLETQMQHMGDVFAAAIRKAVDETVKGITIRVVKDKSGNKTTKVNGYATGTLSAPGGWAMTGERGRELVKLPQGARVYPAAQTQRMIAPTSEPTNVEIHMNNYGPSTGADRRRELEWTLKYATKSDEVKVQ